jgi:hypothetical protein
MALGPVKETWPAPDEAGQPRYRWYEKIGGVLYVFFCFEIGILLMLLPWLDFWNHNYFSGFGVRWAEMWMSPYLRGAVSGLGLLDIVISFIELFRLRRFAQRTPSRPGSLE